MRKVCVLRHLSLTGAGATASFSRTAGSWSAVPPIDFEKVGGSCQRKTGKELAPSQQAALR